MSKAIFFFFILLIIDFYSFQAIKTVANSFHNIYWKYALLTLFFGSILITLMLMLMISFGPDANRQGMSTAIYRFMGAFILFYVPKLILIAFLFGEDIFRLFEWAIASFRSENVGIASRRGFISKTALAVAAIPFAGIIHGLWSGRFNFKVRKVVINSPDLPDAFDGFTMAQISDVHAQGFWGSDGLKKGIDLLKSLKADTVLLTGDLVNNRAEEVDPIAHMMEGISAPYGTYAVLGNHDYGDYLKWPTKEEKNKNHQGVKDWYGKLGFNLLNNDSVKIEKNGQSIFIIGVENWGLKPFPQYGDLDKSLEKVTPNSFKVLLSHDPTHWKEQVLDHKEKFHLTLSGHTHGMQFGVEIPGWVKWSPVKYKYQQWAGKYEDKDQVLYVNRGFGTIGFPGRVGIWPEITHFTFRKTEA